MHLNKADISVKLASPVTNGSCEILVANSQSCLSQTNQIIGPHRVSILHDVTAEVSCCSCNLQFIFLRPNCQTLQMCYWRLTATCFAIACQHSTCDARSSLLKSSPATSLSTRFPPVGRRNKQTSSQTYYIYSVGGL